MSPLEELRTFVCLCQACGFSPQEMVYDTTKEKSVRFSFFFQAFDYLVVCVRMDYVWLSLYSYVFCSTSLCQKSFEGQNRDTPTTISVIAVVTAIHRDFSQPMSFDIAIN